MNKGIMDSLVGKIEKCKPFFEKVSNNSYLRAIRDGFISLIPVILFTRFTNVYIVLLIVSVLWMGTIGFIDDYLKKIRCL